MSDITLTRALVDPQLFGSTFGAQSFWPWRTLGKLIDGLPLTEPRELQLFRECTGRTQLPNRGERRLLRRLIILAGRRAGKDRFESAVAIWRAALCCDWNKFASAGEQQVVILLGRDRKQAAILRRYCSGLLRAPLLSKEVVRQTDDTVEFRNGSSLEISSNDVALVRGRSAIAVLGSETCFWKSDEHSASSDEEVVSAAEKSMAMCHDGGILLLASSVYRKKGYMYRQYRKLFGNDDADDSICWFASSQTMNPRLPLSVIDAAMAEDPHRANAEFNGIWRDDLTDCYPPDAVEGSTDWGIFERPPQAGMFYYCWVDSAGGTGKDSFVLAIAHRLADQQQTVLLDAIREFRPRFIPSEIIASLVPLLKSYRISEIQGDNFAGGFHADEWRKNGIRFKGGDNTTSQNYLFALPMILSKRARLLDNATLRNQLVSLERRTTGAHEQITHPQISSAHDDVATACTGALVIAANRSGFDPLYRGWNDEPEKPASPSRGQTGAELYGYLHSLGMPWNIR